MIIIHKASHLLKQLERKKADGKSIGFVPTMGALHQGHLSLLEEARKNTAFVVVSIFVNPTQFNDPADFNKYPVTIETDILQLEEAGCDLLFLPDLATIYPNGTNNLPTFDMGSLETLLEGASRPGHFQGVCQVMNRLLTLVAPEKLFMGQKDFQQCMVVQRMIHLEKLPVELVTCTTRREPDGLAMSSRNMRLNENERRQATAIYRAMQIIRQGLLAKQPSPEILQKAALQELQQNGFEPIDYIAITHPATLEPFNSDDLNAGLSAIILVAAFLGKVRLIDNLKVG